MIVKGKMGQRTIAIPIDEFIILMKTGVSVGFRWFSPVGPLRIDLAHGFESNNLVRFYLNFGPEL